MQVLEFEIYAQVKITYMLHCFNIATYMLYMCTTYVIAMFICT